jgi:LacI family transcriptional regulator
VTTIKDVAKHAEVSFTTVSHVLNGTRNVSDAVRQRVLKAVQELQYVPSGIARSLKTNRTHTIGIIIPNNSNPFFAEVVRGLEDACFEAGFSAILCNTDDKPAKQLAYARLLGE